jgi:pimeloyl-ACP methyl ester carboxylesterase
MRASRALVLLGVLLSSGCALLGVEEQREAFESFARIRGSVRTENESRGPLVVVLARASDDPNELDPRTGRPSRQVVDHFLLVRGGNFAFAASPGTFSLAAFEDADENLSYDPGEAVLPMSEPFEVGAGETADGIELVISQGVSLDRTFDVLAMEARTPKDQHHFSIGRFTARGQIVDLTEARFGPDSGQMGMWRFVDFLFEVGTGVYFLEDYDPNKTPVLFVHGISGYPQEFSTLIDRLDRSLYQPWFYFYPSGIHLDVVSSHLTKIVTELQRELRFRELAVVAHSMGGLVSRAFILKHYEQTQRRDVKLFVAISSPWGGSASASMVEEAPEDLIVYSWLDMSPDSDFLKGLFYQPPDYLEPRALPTHIPFHMIFGYKRDEFSFGPSADGVLSVKTATRLEAVEAARSVLPLDYDHAGILHSGETVNRLNSILSHTFD